MTTDIELNQPKIERVDDIPVIYGMLERMGVQAILDSHIKRFGEYVIDTETIPSPLQPDKPFLTPVEAPH